MILVDTSVWADHFRSSDPHLVFLWNQAAIVQHSFVTGELAMGNLHRWADTVAALRSLPQAALLADQQVLTFVEQHKLMGTGIGFVDAHILASVHRQPGCALWTRDKRLAAQADRLGIEYRP